jgi:hypothetical protein
MSILRFWNFVEGLREANLQNVPVRFTVISPDEPGRVIELEFVQLARGDDKENSDLIIQLKPKD